MIESQSKQTKSLRDQTNLTFLKWTFDQTLPLQVELHPSQTQSIDSVS